MTDVRGLMIKGSEEVEVFMAKKRRVGGDGGDGDEEDEEEYG